MITRWIIFSSSFALVSVLSLAKLTDPEELFVYIFRYICMYILGVLPPLVCRFCARSSCNIILWLLPRCDDFSHSLKDAARYIIPDLRSSIIRKGMEIYSECIFCENTFARSCDECVPHLKGLPDPECTKIGYLRWWIHKWEGRKRQKERNVSFIPETYILNFHQKDTSREVTNVYLFSLLFSLSHKSFKLYNRNFSFENKNWMNNISR